MHNNKIKFLKVSINKPSCMEMGKEIKIGILKEEDKDERNKKRSKKA